MEAIVGSNSADGGSRKQWRVIIVGRVNVGQFPCDEDLSAPKYSMDC
jgi:hypothetical protein